MMPIASVDVLALEPPPDLLRQIEAMAIAIEVLLRGGAVDAAKAVVGQLRTVVAKVATNAASHPC